MKDQLLDIISNLTFKPSATILNDRNFILFGLLLLTSYISYLVISFFLLKPIVEKKATNQIGGCVKVKSDPLIWVLLVFFLLVYLLSFLLQIFPKF